MRRKLGLYAVILSMLVLSLCACGTETQLQFQNNTGENVETYEPTVIQIEIGTVSIVIPDGWEVTSEDGTVIFGLIVSNDLRITPPVGKKDFCKITIGKSVMEAPLSTENFDRLYSSRTSYLLPRAVEDTVEAFELVVDNGYGVYCILTDASLVGKTIPEDEYLYITIIMISYDNGYISYATIFSDDTNSEDFLSMLDAVSGLILQEANNDESHDILSESSRDLTETHNEYNDDSYFKQVGTWETISAGNGHNFAITEDGSLWVWGRNVAGEHGDGTVTIRNDAYPRIIIEDHDKLIPTKVMEDVVSVAASGTHSLVIKSDGSLWAFGWNKFGQLGDGTNIDRYEPVKIMDNVVAISAGSYHSLVLKEDGSLWSFGNNAYGQLGDGTRTTYLDKGYWLDLDYNDNLETKENNDKSIPVKIMDDVVAISAGSIHNLAIKSDGSLWSWGNNEYGEIGDGSISVKDASYNIVQDNARPTPVRIMEDVVFISAGYSHNLAIKNDGSLWAWGDNNHGKLGDGTGYSHDSSGKYNRLSPVKVLDDVIYASAGGDHSFAIRIDGNLWAWGDYTRQTDTGGVNRAKNTPIRIMSDVAIVSAGAWHSLAVKTNGSLWSWGANLNGNLGDGKITIWDWDMLIENNDRIEPEIILYDVKLQADTSTLINPPSDIIRVYLDGNLLAFDQPPIIENGRTLVPFRSIFEAFGASVYWNESTQTITALNAGIEDRYIGTIRLTIGSDILLMGTEEIKLDVLAKIVNGRTLVPLRVIAECYGADIKWDSESLTITISILEK
ncbi:MAG: stalk domain-containing protein [Oscillospiraceae bacterium]|nr:stalk domain-containing protein [Oscillospiraceae bacterium]